MSDAHIEDHSSLIKTPKQLVVVVVLAFLVPVIALVMLAKLVSGGLDTRKDRAAMSEDAVASRIKPVGEVMLAGAPGAAAVEKTGEQVYTAVCAACHATGALSAPKTSDKAAWGKLIKQGLPTITATALKGIRQMPARGGNPDLTDLEVERAVVYMANQAGASWKEREAKPVKVVARDAGRSGAEVVKAACAQCHDSGKGSAPKIGDRAEWTKRASLGVDAAVQSAIKGHGNMPARGGMADLTDSELKRAIEYMLVQGGAVAAAPAPAAAAPAAADKGKALYDTACAACHAAGVAGAPKAGDKAAWAPRVKTGKDALYATVMKGKGAMPPKGGAASASDADIKAAVDYLVGLAK